MITSVALDEFKAIMQDDYGLWLDDTKAVRLAEDYLTAFEAVLKSPKDHLTKPAIEEQNDRQ